VAHLIGAASFDSGRILQQSVCYDSLNTVTVSVVWGYAVQVYEGNKLLPDLLTLQKTFSTWRRGSGVQSNYMFSTREYPRDPCGRPLVFFLDSVGSDGTEGTWSNYNIHRVGHCHRAEAVERLERIRVLSPKLERNVEQVGFINTDRFSVKVPSILPGFTFFFGFLKIKCQMGLPRRQCCDISSPYNKSMVINIRQCMPDELIAMNT